MPVNKKIKSKRDEELFKKICGKIVLEALQDPKARQALKKNPRKIFEEHGVNLDKSKKIKILENTKDTIYVTLPYMPGGKLSPEQLEQVSGGFIGFFASLLTQFVLSVVLGTAVVGAQTAIDNSHG